MADIDLKTETPDTTLPTTGFLFGADSQAAASPSVYSTQTVATTLLGSTSLTGATVTTSQPVLDLSQTWNAGAVTFTGLKFNATDTASAAGSLLMDLQVGGASRFSAGKDGSAVSSGGISTSHISPLTSNGWVALGGGFGGLGSSSEFKMMWLGGTESQVKMRSDATFGWTSTTNVGSLTAMDTILTRRAAANLRLGAADAASPVAQTLSVQSVAAGNSNVAGANLTITGSQGTGTGAGGSIIFQVAPAGSSGTAQNALVDALTIAGNRIASFASAVIASSFQIAGGGGASINTNGVNIANTAAVNFSSGTGSLGTPDVLLARDAANTLALRNGANGQALRVYNTFTSATDFERANIFWDSNVLKIGTEKGSAGGTARALEFQTDGTTALTLTTGQKAEFAQTIKTAAPSGGTAAEWKLGTVASVSPTSPDRTIEVEIGGTTYYISAKTTND